MNNILLHLKLIKRRECCAWNRSKIELLKLQKSQSVELKNIRKNERTISIAAQNVHYILEDTIERVPATHRDRLQIT